MKTSLRTSVADGLGPRAGGWGARLLLYATLIVLTLLTGLVSASGMPLLVGLVAGLIVSAGLLVAPRWAVTALLALGLTLGVVLSLLGPDAARLSWGISLLGFFLLLPAILHLDNLKKTPAFVYVAATFMLYAVGSTIVQWHGPGEILAGFKRHLLPYGLLLALALAPFEDKDYRQWRMLLIAIALLQLPFALYEFLVLVPQRGGLAAGSAVTDVVAGTMGANMRGGSPNSVMVFLLMLVLSFLLAWWKEGLLKPRWVLYSLPFILLPIVMAEVKIAFIMLLLIFMVVFRNDIIKRPAMFFGMALVGTGVLLALGYALLEWIMRASLDHVIKDTLSYNVQNVGYGGLFLNRTTALTFWWQHQGWDDPIGFMFGHGLGSSHLDENALVAGHVAINWPGYGIGLTTASQLLWDVGIVGFGVYLLMYGAAWRAADRLRRRSHDKGIAADAIALQASIALFALMIVYNDNLVVLPALQVLFGAMLGYLAYLSRKVVELETTPPHSGSRNIRRTQQ